MKAREQIGKCTKCGKLKAVHEFSKDKRCKFGIRPECKACETRRGSYSLKSIRFRLKHCPQWYSGISCTLTAKQIESIPNICFFCNQPLEAVTIHRLDHKSNYEISNISKVHKSCHAKHGGHTTAKGSNKGYGTTKR